MAQQNRQKLKSYFETGDIPTQQEYQHLIDSFATLSGDTNSGSIELTGSLSATSGIIDSITASGNISSSGIIYASSISASGTVLVTGTSQFSSTITAPSITNVNSLTNVTASGTISASGNIFGDHATFLTGSITSIANVNTSNITASGDISASGTASFQGGVRSGGDIWLPYGGGLYALDQNDNFLTTDPDNGIVRTSLDNRMEFGNVHVDFMRFFADKIELGGAEGQVVDIAAGRSTVNIGSTANNSSCVIGGAVTSSGDISSSGNLIAAAVSIDTLTTDTISSTAGSVNFTTDIILNNNEKIKSVNSLGSSRDIAYVSSGNNLIIGQTNMPAQIVATSITLDATSTVKIDSDTGDVQFADGGTTKITFNTTDGHITASGNLFANGNLSASNFGSSGNITIAGTISNVSTTNVTASNNVSSSAGLIANTLQIDGSQVDFTNLPTSDPSVAGRLWNNGSYVKISAG